MSMVIVDLLITFMSVFQMPFGEYEEPVGSLHIWSSCGIAKYISASLAKIN